MSITEVYSARDFAQYARKKIAEIESRGKLPILCGGTGLYMDSVLYDLEVPSFESNPEFQAELESYRLSQGNLALWERFAKLDPEYAREIHPNSYPYVMRGLEVFVRTGRSKQEFKSVRTPRYEVTSLSPPPLTRDELYARIGARVQEMFANGWIEEVEELLCKGYSKEAPGFNSIGYREVIEHLEGSLSRDELIARVSQLTRNYAKRQITWGRRTINSL